VTATASKLTLVDGPQKTFRSVEVAKKAERDNWALADAILQDIHDLNPALTQVRADGVNTGRTEAEKMLHEEMTAAGVADFTPAYLHNLYVTSRAWPPEDRIEQATFRAHYLLRSQTYDKKRKAVLERLAKKSKGRVNQLAVQVWISEHKPRQQYTFLQLVERRIRGSVKGAAAPWHLVAEDDRQAIAAILHRVAAEVEDGTFPKKAKT
jgi:hypothetical protein